MRPRHIGLLTLAAIALGFTLIPTREVAETYILSCSVAPGAPAQSGQDGRGASDPVMRSMPQFTEAVPSVRQTLVRKTALRLAIERRLAWLGLPADLASSNESCG